VCRGTERTGSNISALSRDRSLSGAQEPITLTISSVWMQMTSPGCTSNAGRDDGNCLPFLRSPARMPECFPPHFGFAINEMKNLQIKHFYLLNR
jgi:hypothetical protein